MPFPLRDQQNVVIEYEDNTYYRYNLPINLSNVRSIGKSWYYPKGYGFGTDGPMRPHPTLQFITLGSNDADMWVYPCKPLTDIAEDQHYMLTDVDCTQRDDDYAKILLRFGAKL